MSLIQEALEKTGRLAGARIPGPVPVVHQRTPVVLIEKKKEALVPAPKPPAPEGSPKTKLLVSGVLILLSVVGFAFFATQNMEKTPGPSAKSSGSMNVPKPLAESLSTLVTPPASTSHQFYLTGITASEGKQYALINNQLVGIGDRLNEGAVVQSIENRKVLLRFKDRDIELSL